MSRRSRSVRAGVITDLHMSDKAPQGRTPDYSERIFEKFREVGKIARDRKWDLVLFGGDFFHNKRANFNSHDLVGRCVEEMRTWPPSFGCLGNHDLASARIDSFLGQPIGVLHRAGVLTILTEDFVWGDESMLVQISPAHYVPTIDTDPANYSLDRVDGVDYAIKLAHGMLAPPGKTFPGKGKFLYTPMDTVPRAGLDAVFYGHPHYDFGVQKIEGTYFGSFGSLARVALTRYNRRRKIRVMEVIFGPNGIEFEEHWLSSMRPAGEVFLLDERAAADAAEVELDEPMGAFARKLAKAIRKRSTSVTVEELIERFGKKVSAGTRTELRRYLVEAGYDEAR